MKDTILVEINEITNSLDGDRNYYIVGDVIFETKNCDKGRIHFIYHKKLIVGKKYEIIYEDTLSNILKIREA